MTAAQLAAKMIARSAAVEPEFRKTTNSLGIKALRFCRERITAEIYAKPVPKTANGKPLWKRTGNLRRSEQIENRGSYSVVIVNRASYALYRHEAGKPGRRPTRYPAHWRDELVKTFRPIIANAHRLTVQRILKRGL